MLSSKSTHKRRRSSARRDAASAVHQGGSSIVTLKGVGEESQDSIDEIGKLSQFQQFTYQLEAVIPVCNIDKARELAVGLEKLPTVRSYAAKISPLLLLDPIFSTCYLKRGRFLLLSAGRLEDQDIICIDSRTRLTLSLTRDTYQTLGLQGQAYKRAQTSSGRCGDRLSGRSDRFVVSIDLLAPSFEPGKANYERVKARLKAWDVARGDLHSTGSWNVVMNWTSGVGSFGEVLQVRSSHAVPSSVKELLLRCDILVIEDVWVPEASQFARLHRGWTDAKGDEGADESWSEWLEELNTLLEYTTLTSLGAQCVRTFSRPDELNTYEVPSPRDAGACVVAKYVGLVPSTLAKHLMQTVLALIPASGVNCLQLRSTSFADSPIIWTGGEANELLAQATPTHVQSDADDVGVRARRKRNSRRQKRGYTNPEQLGHQIRNAQNSLSVGGWLLCHLGSARLGSLITLKDVGDSAVS